VEEEDERRRPAAAEAAEACRAGAEARRGQVASAVLRLYAVENVCCLVLPPSYLGYAKSSYAVEIQYLGLNFKNIKTSLIRRRKYFSSKMHQY
jgi:hypothetical protein